MELTRVHHGLNGLCNLKGEQPGAKTKTSRQGQNKTSSQGQIKTSSQGQKLKQAGRAKIKRAGPWWRS